MGDLSENADYIVAKEEQAFLEGRILELETILREAVVVEGRRRHRRSGQRPWWYPRSGGPPRPSTLVGIKEADPRQGRISHELPIGLALLGHRQATASRRHARRHTRLRHSRSPLDAILDKARAGPWPALCILALPARWRQERASVPRGHARSSIVSRSK